MQSFYFLLCYSYFFLLIRRKNGEIIRTVNFAEVKYMKKMFFRAKTALLILILLFSLLLGVSISSEAACKKIDTGTDLCFSQMCVSTNHLSADSTKVSSRFYELFFGQKEKNGQKELYLCPSGEAFGIIIKEDGVTVSSSTCTALLGGDRIIRIGKTDCDDSEDVYTAVRESGGAPLNIRIIRGGEEKIVCVTPKYKDGEYKLGITLRAQTAGIGTITFIDPETLSFGGLGHAVSDAETGEPVSVKSGSACQVTLGACKKGEAGKAGELSGILSRTPIGSITKNTECGVFGRLDNEPKNLSSPIPIAHRDDVRLGEAEIISTIKNGKTSTYRIEITDIDESSNGSKSFKIKVTDPALVALTGGIVRGMSGSPIIQDGKLVGAVTHVLVANPTEGYGIFIENMLNAAQSQVQPKAA